MRQRHHRDSKALVGVSLVLVCIGCGEVDDPGSAGSPSIAGIGGGPVFPAGAGGVGGAAGTPGTSGSGGEMGLPTGGVGGMAQGGVGGDAGSAGTGGAAGAAGAAGSEPGVPCTGKPGATGNVTKTWAQEQASYIIHYPPGLDPNQPVPLVFVAHGFTMSGASMQQITGFDAVADANKFVVVYPNGNGGGTPWNVGPGTCAPGALVDAPAADSFAYLEAMRAEVEASQCIHPNKIFITGFSMGGYFSHNVACQKGNTLVRAAGPCSGGTYQGNCPGAPVPIFIMHGASDTFIDFNSCGKTARDYWIARNKCGTTFDTKQVMGGTCEWYKDCDPNGQTVFCSFTGVAHSWAGGATSAVWSFFQGYL